MSSRGRAEALPDDVHCGVERFPFRVSLRIGLANLTVRDTPPTAAQLDALAKRIGRQVIRMLDEENLCLEQPEMREWLMRSETPT